MKKVFVTALMALAVLISCQKEVNFENANGGSGGSGGGTAACKACSYIPMCDGSVYSYYDTMFTSGPAVTSDTLLYIKDTVFSGLTFRKFQTKGYSTPYFTNCTNGVFRNAAFNLSATGGPITKIELVMLKDNIPVNGTWEDTITNGIGQAVYYKSKIIAKGVSRTLHSNTFPDVIHVQTENGVEIPIIGYFKTGVSDYYYAKGVGLVEANIANADGSVVFQHRVIKSYNIP